MSKFNIKELNFISFKDFLAGKEDVLKYSGRETIVNQALILIEEAGSLIKRGF